MMERGLHTFVGKEYDESGVNFSGGERQKMAIARAIYKDAPFVIMDEPTAALDPVSEYEVYAGFDQMIGGKKNGGIRQETPDARRTEDRAVRKKTVSEKPPCTFLTASPLAASARISWSLTAAG